MHQRWKVWIKSPRLHIAIIGGCILVLASCAWIVPARYLLAHNILHHLNFIPLMLAGMLYGWRGAIYSMFFAAIVYAPHLVLSSDISRLEASDQLVELSIFGGAGIIAGLLADRERKQRFNLEKTKRELEDVYQELQQNIERLKKAERLYAAGQLSASLAHEIRNPLAGISGAAGILKRGNASPQNVSACLEIIERESDRLNKLLTNFLVFARPRAPRFQRTDFKAVIESVTSLAAHAPTVASVRTLLDLPENLPEVTCDPELLKQVLLNLLINATEATPPGGLVTLSARCEDSRIAVHVRDEGCGIPPEEEDKIFDPFFTTKENGTGLGLSIASKIIEQHGGSLTVERNSDKGMTFRLELPLGGGVQ
jgi:two-component system, NtrC family, sensor histidine kinase HydH